MPGFPLAVAPIGFQRPVTLRGRFVDLVPLERAHVTDLARAGRDPEIWRYLRIGPGRTEGEMQALVEELLAREAAGDVLPFTVLARADSAVLGMFRYLEIDRPDHAVELGTWLTPSVWRTPVNTELKYLGLRYAFEDEGCHRVQLKTDLRNRRSQRAIERLGAVREGILRDHFRRRDGSYRTSVYYSLLAPEWPTVRAALEAKLARPWHGPADRAPTPGAGTSAAASP